MNDLETIMMAIDEIECLRTQNALYEETLYAIAKSRPRKDGQLWCKDKAYTALGGKTRMEQRND